MGYRLTETGDQQVVLYGADGNVISTTNRLAVDGLVTVHPGGGGASVPGAGMRYEHLPHFDIPKNSDGFGTAFEIDEASVFYKVLFAVDSDNIHVQVEIDGQDIFPTPDGILLEDLEDWGLKGNGNGNGNPHRFGEWFGFYEISSNVWVWRPPEPLYVSGSWKLKMKASDSSTNKDLESGLLIRRATV